MPSGELAEVVAGDPDLAVYAGPVTTAGRVELLPFLREQAISITAHRFGNPDPWSEEVISCRASIVLAVADGGGTSAVSKRLGVSRPTVIKWRDRFAEHGEHGIAGPDDEPRSGRPKVVDGAAILASRLEPPSGKLAVTHWSTRLLASHLRIGDATVAWVWCRYGIKPWRRETFTFSTGPELEAKIRDVVGLYLALPENAIVLCLDQKSQIQKDGTTAATLHRDTDRPRDPPPRHPSTRLRRTTLAAEPALV